MPQVVEEPKKVVPAEPAKLPDATEPKRIDLFNFRELAKTSDYSPDKYSQHFKDLIERTKSNFNYSKDFVANNIKGDSGFEKYCCNQLDSIILEKGKNLNSSAKNYLTEVKFLVTLYQVRSEIKEYNAQSNPEIEKIRKNLFETLLPKSEAISTAKDLKSIDGQLRSLTYAAFVSRGEVEQSAVQQIVQDAVRKVNSFSNADIQSYFKLILQSDERVTENAEPYKHNEIFAGSLVTESSGIIPAGKFIYRIKDLFVKAEKDEYCFDFKASNGDRWRLGLTSFDGEGIIYLRNLKTGAFASLEAEELSKMVPAYSGKEKAKTALATGRLNLDKFLEEVNKEHSLEHDESRRKMLLEKDLKKGETAFFAVYPKQNDPVITSSLLMSVIKERVFAARYDLPIATGRYYFSDSPLKDIEKEIDRQLVLNPKIKMFYIDINSHGSDTEFKFKTPLKIVELVELFNKNKYKEKGLEFNIETLACFGAGVKQGLVEAYKKDPNLKINAFMHTKPYVPNLGISVSSLDSLVLPEDPERLKFGFTVSDHKGTNEQVQLMVYDRLAKLHPPYMELLFLTEMMDPNVRTLGEAFHKADLKVREHISINAEAVIGGVIQTGGEKKPGEKPKFER